MPDSITKGGKKHAEFAQYSDRDCIHDPRRIYLTKPVRSAETMGRLLIHQVRTDEGSITEIRRLDMDRAEKKKELFETKPVMQAIVSLAFPSVIGQIILVI